MNYNRDFGFAVCISAPMLTQSNAIVDNQIIGCVFWLSLRLIISIVSDNIRFDKIHESPEKGAHFHRLKTNN